ncbi:UNVERIFIED_CONTAM: hypothetical protein Sangu_2604800 [Sesamum angustifolium]|uniref:Uncharacterized protein n=1 Tax=Sesamum angustifolium TaxID=2727405 RepID=A0AAW2J5U1_9LAMI
MGRGGEAGGSERDQDREEEEADLGGGEEARPGGKIVTFNNENATLTADRLITGTHLDRAIEGETNLGED